MKIKFLLLGTAITTFAFTTFAADALLTPRAAGNQIKVVPGITAAQPAPATAVLLTPRTQDYQIKTVAGVANDSNPAVACAKNMTASPKAISECSSHATIPGCKKVASMK